MMSMMQLQHDHLMVKCNNTSSKIAGASQRIVSAAPTWKVEATNWLQAVIDPQEKELADLQTQIKDAKKKAAKMAARREGSKNRVGLEARKASKNGIANSMMLNKLKSMKRDRDASMKRIQELHHLVNLVEASSQWFDYPGVVQAILGGRKIDWPMIQPVEQRAARPTSSDQMSVLTDQVSVLMEVTKPVEEPGMMEL